MFSRHLRKYQCNNLQSYSNFTLKFQVYADHFIPKVSFRVIEKYIEKMIKKNLIPDLDIGDVFYFSN